MQRLRTGFLRLRISSGKLPSAGNFDRKSTDYCKFCYLISNDFFALLTFSGLDLLGLVVISVGTGGVKACVAAFGADQFPQGYVTMISVYFAVFYWTIQAGSTLSTVITPIFRSEHVDLYLNANQGQNIYA